MYNFDSIVHLTEEVILAEERTTEEEKQHIIEGTKSMYHGHHYIGLNPCYSNSSLYYTHPFLHV